MKCINICALVIAMHMASAGATIAAANPLSKVIDMMDSLIAKVTADADAEAKAFKEYVEWCDDATANVQLGIKAGSSKKAELEAAITKAAADIQASEAKVEDLSASISADESELRDATAVRQSEVSTFEASESELVSAIDTLDRAINIIQRDMMKNPASLAQVDTKNVDAMVKSLGEVINAASFTAQDQKTLTALVQSHVAESDEDELGAPTTSAYVSHSSNIFDLLEDLKEKAEGQLAELRKSEASGKHNYNMLKQSLDDQIGADTKDLNNEKSLKAASQEAKAVAEGDLAEVAKTLSEDKSQLDATSSGCMASAADHESAVSARAEELKTLATAKKILQDSTSGASDQAYAFIQVVSSSGTRLHTRADLANAEVVGLVRKLAHDHHSAALAQLASRIATVIRYGASSGENPFTKVRGLISDMIAKLEAEALADLNEKSYCDTELAKSESKKAELQNAISKLTSKVDLAAAKSAKLKASVKETQGELANLAREQASMDGIRAESKAAYNSAKADLEAGITGVQKALRMLKDYYGSAALLQQPASPALHTKASGAGGGIIDILEVVESDFAKALAAEDSQESDAIAAYEKTTQENKVAKTMKEQDVKYNTKEFKALDKSISEQSGDRDTTNTELAAVLEYYGKLKERCIAKPESYSERRSRRDAEIAGLKEALSILENETAFMQRRGKRLRSSQSVM